MEAYLQQMLMNCKGTAPPAAILNSTTSQQQQQQQQTMEEQLRDRIKLAVMSCVAPEKAGSPMGPAVQIHCTAIVRVGKDAMHTVCLNDTLSERDWQFFHMTQTSFLNNNANTVNFLGSLFTAGGMKQQQQQPQPQQMFTTATPSSDSVNLNHVFNNMLNNSAVLPAMSNQQQQQQTLQNALSLIVGVMNGSSSSIPIVQQQQQQSQQQQLMNQFLLANGNAASQQRTSTDNSQISQPTQATTMTLNSSVSNTATTINIPTATLSSSHLIPQTTSAMSNSNNTTFNNAFSPASSSNRRKMHAPTRLMNSKLGNGVQPSDDDGEVKIEPNEEELVEGGESVEGHAMTAENIMSHEQQKKKRKVEPSRNNGQNLVFHNWRTQASSTKVTSGGAQRRSMSTKCFRCNQCKNPFPSLNALCDHTLEVHGSFKCTICDSKFTQRSNLQRHALKHVGFKPFECVICGKAYYRKDHSIRHVEVTHAQSDPKRSIKCYLTSSQCLDYLEGMEQPTGGRMEMDQQGIMKREGGTAMLLCEAEENGQSGIFMTTCDESDEGEANSVIESEPSEKPAEPSGSGHNVQVGFPVTLEESK